MRILALAGEVEISWLADAPALILQASEVLDGDGWYPAGPEPELDGAWFHVRVPVGDEPLFFRLVDPLTP